MLIQTYLKSWMSGRRKSRSLDPPSLQEGCHSLGDPTIIRVEFVGSAAKTFQTLRIARQPTYEHTQDVLDCVDVFIDRLPASSFQCQPIQCLVHFHIPNHSALNAVSCLSSLASSHHHLVADVDRDLWGCVSFVTRLRHAGRTLRSILRDCRLASSCPRTQELESR